ncbi:MAG TPA: glycosyltransferase [Clostridiales bacterium]|nr:glycosyltransferase [Clostridiales bacterium]
MDKVSVIIPVYNTEKYLGKAIDSCLNQTFKDVEIIIVNDGSTDKSLYIAQQYENVHQCVSVITTENKGLSEARNTGLKLAKGEYVYFLDSDDWIEPETIECCYKLAVKNDLNMVLFDSAVEVEPSIEPICTIDYDYCMRNNIVNESSIYTGRGFVELYADRGGTFVQAWLVFINKEFLLSNQIYFLTNAYYEDVAFHFSCMMAAERIMYIPQPFHIRLYRADSIMTSSLNIRKVFSVYEIALEMYSSIMAFQNGSDNIWIQYLFRLMRNLHRMVFGNVSRKDNDLIKPYYTIIQELQSECILFYYKLLNASNRKVSNVRLALEFAEEIVTPFGGVSNGIIDTIKMITQERDLIIFDIFSKLPINKKGKKIGIYGTGNHADSLLKKYGDIIGDIKGDIIFIDSYKKSFSDRYRNYKIINIDDLEQQNISEIIILSYLYEEEMYSNIISRYGDRYKIHRIYNGDKEPIDSTYYLKVYNRLLQIHENGRKKIILINTPEHDNIGDHMIAYAALKLFQEFLPDYDVLEVTNKRYIERRKEIIYRINFDDIIVITGGGYFGSLWPYSGQNVYKILEDFKENKIVMLPQSMFFEENEAGESQKQLTYNLFVAHRNINVCFREILSYIRAESIFGDKIKKFLIPDMALMLNYSQEQSLRKGILLCIRNDKEGILSENEKRSLKEYFYKWGEETEETSMRWKIGIKANQREEVIMEKIGELKKKKLVITDTLHCMISCVISGTPCIALNNVNRKLEGIYQSWIKDLKYIRYVDSYEDIFGMDLENWKELHEDNYYNKSYFGEVKRLVNIICN